MKKIIIFLVLIILIVIASYLKEYSIGTTEYSFGTSDPDATPPRCLGEVKVLWAGIGRSDFICHGILIK